MNNIEKLKNLYLGKSKHSNYQILTQRLANLIEPSNLNVKTRYERERLKYILKNINIKNKRVLDIGGNTGYFSFELLDLGAKHVYYYEGNKEHTEFVKLASKILELEKNITVFNKYFSFDNKFNLKGIDIILLLNVLHHIGDDYGDPQISIDSAKAQILTQINSLSEKTTTLIFQMGFNWKGNRDLGLFPNGSKKEMIEFISEGVNDNWEIINIGIPHENAGEIEYQNVNENNLIRRDDLGEFLNRPLFILKSKNSRKVS